MSMSKPAGHESLHHGLWVRQVIILSCVRTQGGVLRADSRVHDQEGCHRAPFECFVAILIISYQFCIISRIGAATKLWASSRTIAG